MRYLFMTDTHLAPSMGGRGEQYPNDILAKMEWADELALKEGVDAILHGGDLYDRPIVPRWIEHAVARMIQHSVYHWCIVPGTHDIGRGVPSTDGKSIGALSFHSRALLGSPDDITTISELSAMLVPPSGDLCWATHGEREVIVVHQMLSPEPVPWDHILTKDIRVGAKVVLSGDLHIGFESHVYPDKSETIFANPGALARTFRDKHDNERQPQVALVDTDKPIATRVLYIPVPSNLIRPAEECMRAERAQSEGQEELRGSLSQAIRDAQGMGMEDWRERLRRLREDPSRLLGLCDHIVEGLDCLMEACMEVEDSSKQGRVRKE
jgi:exonuclease SbcD